MHTQHTNSKPSRFVSGLIIAAGVAELGLGTFYFGRESSNLRPEEAKEKIKSELVAAHNIHSNDPVNKSIFHGTIGALAGLLGISRFRRETLRAENKALHQTLTTIGSGQNPS